MHIDVPSLDRQHALIGLQHGIDDSGVGLRAAYQKVDISLRLTTCLAHLVTRCGTVIIQSVTCCAIIVCLNEPSEYSLVTAIVVITLK